MAHKVLITGSSGFIGSQMIGLLISHGYEVIGLDIRPPDKKKSLGGFVLCDILDADKLRHVFSENKPETVIHLAARTDLDENKDIQGYAVNFQGTENLIKAIRDSGSVKRVLHTSSQLVCKVGYIPKTATDYRPSNLYGESKVLMERIVRDSVLPGVDWCLLRPTTIWGEGMSPHYQRFLKMVKNGHYVHIGNKPLYKSYGYIGNTVYQYLKFIDAPSALIRGNTFYIADYHPLSLRDWIDKLAKEFGIRRVNTLPEPMANILGRIGDILNYAGLHKFPFNSFRLQNILTEYIFDLSSTENICGPLPYSFEEGVVRTAKWYIGVAD